MNEIIETTARTAQTIAAEIRFLDRQAADTCIRYIIEIGRRLVEAKSLVGEGQWLQYIRTELNYERSTAQNYMRLYERFGTGQASMFGSFTDSQTFGSLTYTKALALLQVPEEDLEEFADTHDIASMSTRELKQAIRERDDAVKAQKDAEQRADELAQKCDQNLSEMLEYRERACKAEEQVERLTAGMNEAAEKLDAWDDKYDALKKELEYANQREKEALKSLEKAKAEPDIPSAMMEQLRAESEAAGAKKAREEAQKAVDAAEQAKIEATKEVEDLKLQLEEAKKATRLGNPAAIAFKPIFEQVQLDFQRLCNALEKVRQEDAGTADKLTAATKALLDKLAKDIGG